MSFKVKLVAAILKGYSVAKCQYCDHFYQYKDPNLNVIKWTCDSCKRKYFNAKTIRTSKRNS